MDGRTDKHDVYRTITFNRSCNVLKVNPSGKKAAYGAKRMPKQKTISNSNAISILGIPSTDSRHNGKCNLCAFCKEIHVFGLDFCQIIKSCSCFWMDHKLKQVYSLIDRFRSIYDVRSYMLILPFTIKTGQSVAQNRQKMF